MSNRRILPAGLFVAGVMLLGSNAIGQGKNSEIKLISGLIKKGDMVAARKAAAAFAIKNSDIEDVMIAFKPLKKNGLGVGGADPGIEQTLIKLGREVPTATTVATMAGAYEEMGYNIAAVGLMNAELAPKNHPKDIREHWIALSTGLLESGNLLAKAAKNKQAEELKTIAAKINANCSACHLGVRAGFVLPAAPKDKTAPR